MQMDLKINCSQCERKMKIMDRLYYCCDSAEKFCTLCSKSVCKLCFKERGKQHKITRCNGLRCDNRNTVEDCFYDWPSSKYFCPTCVADGLRKYSYRNNVFLSNISYPKEEVKLFLQSYCKNCLVRINPKKAEEVQKGVYVCKKCGNKKQKNLSMQIMKCNICFDPVSRENVGIQEEGVLVCKQCAKDSYLQEKNMEIQKQILHQRVSGKEKLVKEMDKKQFEEEKLPKEIKELKQKKEVKEEKKEIKPKKEESKLDKYGKLKIISQKSIKSPKKNQIKSMRDQKIYQSAIQMKKVKPRKELKPKTKSKVMKSDIVQPEKLDESLQEFQKKNQMAIQEENSVEEMEEVEEMEKKEEIEQKEEIEMERSLKRNDSAELIENLLIEIQSDKPEDSMTCFLCGLQTDGMSSITGTNTQNIMCRGCFTLQNNKTIGFRSSIQQRTVYDRRNHVTASKNERLERSWLAPRQTQTKYRNSYGFGTDFYGMPTTQKAQKIFRYTDIKGYNPSCAVCQMVKMPCSKHMR